MSKTQSEHESLAVIEKQIELFGKIIDIFHPEITFWEAERKDLFCRLFFKKSFLEIKIEMLSKKINPATNFAMDKGNVDHAKKELKKITLSDQHIEDIFLQMPSTKTHTPMTAESRKLNKLICKIAEKMEIKPNQIFEPNEIPLQIQQFKQSSFKCYRCEWSEEEGFTQLATFYDDNGKEINIKLNNELLHKAECSPLNYANLNNMTAFQLNHDGFDIEACLINTLNNEKRTKHIPGHSVKSHQALNEIIATFHKKNKSKHWGDPIIRAIDEDTNSTYIHALKVPSERMAKTFQLLDSKHKVRFALFKSSQSELLFMHSDFLSSQLPVNKIAVVVINNPQCTHLQITSTENPNIHSSWYFSGSEYEDIKNYFRNLNFPVHTIKAF